ncbi:hypothetical protein ACH5RR_017809 [Cinchona calisaya]|uniref:DUF4408 domain-containing protein n=1 Tax=Cinchona calisaya TaxID=153742 RepID=A0ABD2ZNA3_9GENT
MAVKFSVPSIIAFTSSDLPLVWNSLQTWLKPPYLYFIINGIIISIAASTRFNHHHQYSKDDDSQEPLIYSFKTPPPQFDYVVAAAAVVLPPPLPEQPQPQPAVEMYDESEEAKIVEEELKPVVENDDHVDDVAGDNWMMTLECNLTSSQKIVSPEKPLLSSRFGHRKPIKTSPEGGRTLRVARPKRQETLESTWKTITEGRHVPLTRHSKKSDTWENHGRTNCDVPTVPLMSLSPISGKIKKEPTLSHDELNRRVEAFIKKFNEEMRLQRQESLNQYMEMINRGAY